MIFLDILKAGWVDTHNSNIVKNFLDIISLQLILLKI